MHAAVQVQKLKQKLQDLASVEDLPVQDLPAELPSVNDDEEDDGPQQRRARALLNILSTDEFSADQCAEQRLVQQLRSTSTSRRMHLLSVYQTENQLHQTAVAHTIENLSLIHI